MSCVIVIFLNQKNLSPVYNWLAKNHIANFDDYHFIIKKNSCDDLANSGVQINRFENDSCQISAGFKVISAIGDRYKIQLNTGKLNDKIVFIKKSDIAHLEEVSSRMPTQSHLDNTAELFSKLYGLKMLVAVKSNDELIVSEQGLIQEFVFEIKKNSDKALSLGNYLRGVNNLIKLEDNASLINKDYSGTILASLLDDKDNLFFHLLMNRLENSFRHVDATSPVNINYILKFFVRIAKKDNYRLNFQKLNYWQLESFDNEMVIELIHRQDNIDILLLYFSQQELAISIALKDPEFLLSIKDSRIKNFINSIVFGNNLA